MPGLQNVTAAMIAATGFVVAVAACSEAPSPAAVPSRGAAAGATGPASSPAVTQPASGAVAVPNVASAPPPRSPQAGAAGAAAAAPTAAAGAPVAAADAAGAAATSASTPMTAAGPCDRACLTTVLDTYFAALAAKDPSMVKVATAVKATENGVATPFGKGVFESGGKVRADTRMDFVDLQEGQIGSQVVFDDGQSMPVIYQVRLKVVAHEITEIETMAVRKDGSANGFFNLDGMKPQPVFKQPVEESKRMPRAELKATVDKYFDALDSGDWTMAMTPFDDACARYENGVATARGAKQIKSQKFNFDVQRRYLVFDEEMGLVWGMFPFASSDRSLVVGELFKVMDQKIWMIQAVMAYMPAKAWNRAAAPSQSRQ